jgi:hypothetical protein
MLVYKVFVYFQIFWLYPSLCQGMVLDMNELGKEQKGNVTMSKVFTIDTVKP